MFASPKKRKGGEEGRGKGKEGSKFNYGMNRGYNPVSTAMLWAEHLRREAELRRMHAEMERQKEARRAAREREALANERATAEELQRRAAEKHARRARRAKNTGVAYRGDGRARRRDFDRSWCFYREDTARTAESMPTTKDLTVADQLLRYPRRNGKKIGNKSSGSSARSASSCAGTSVASLPPPRSEAAAVPSARSAGARPWEGLTTRRSFAAGSERSRGEASRGRTSSAAALSRRSASTPRLRVPPALANQHETAKPLLDPFGSALGMLKPRKIGAYRTALHDSFAAAGLPEGKSAQVYRLQQNARASRLP